jgi:hypothetical protein
MSSVTVSCSQPPASAMAARRQMPAVPLKLKKRPERLRAMCSMTEVAVQHHGLALRERGVLAVDVAPARLHHADLLVGEVVDQVADDARRGHEVRVEHHEELALGDRGGLGQRAGLVSRAVRAVQVDRVEAARAQLFHLGGGDLHGLVRAVVQHLDLELVLGVVEQGDALEQTLGDVHLVEHRQLHRDQRQVFLGVGRGRLADVLAVLPIQHQQVATMEAVDAEDGERDEVQDDDGDLHG